MLRDCRTRLRSRQSEQGVPRVDDTTFPVLTEAERVRWDIARSSVRALSAEASWSPVSEESIDSTFNQLGQLRLETMPMR